MATAVGPGGGGDRPLLGAAERAAKRHFSQGGPRKRDTMFVGSGDPGARGLVLLLDNEPRPRRAAVWTQLIHKLESMDLWIAAYASWPIGGPDDGACEVVAVHAYEADEPAIRRVWVEVCLAEDGL